MTTKEPTVELAHSTIDRWGWRLMVVWLLTVSASFAVGWGASVVYSVYFAGVE